MKTLNGWLVIALSSLTACAAVGKDEKPLQSWLGKPAEQFIQAWGAPQNTQDIPDGGKLLEYFANRTGPGYANNLPLTVTHDGAGNMAISNGYTNYPIYPGPSSYNLKRPAINQKQPTPSCITRITVGKDGAINNWSQQGEDCRIAQ